MHSFGRAPKCEKNKKNRKIGKELETIRKGGSKNERQLEDNDPTHPFGPSRTEAVFQPLLRRFSFLLDGADRPSLLFFSDCEEVIEAAELLEFEFALDRCMLWDFGLRGESDKASCALSLER